MLCPYSTLPMSSLVLENVSFAYRSRPEHPVLRGIDASISLTSHTLVLGPNGSGKTALARVLAGLDNPTGGTVRWPDPPAGRENGRMRAGVVFEQPEFQFQGFSVREELTSGLRYRGVGHEEAGEMVEREAGNFGFAGLLDSPLDSLGRPAQLSVLAASFILLEPELLVLDFSLAELTHGFRELLLEVCPPPRGRTALVVLSRRAEDLAILPDADEFVLDEGRLLPLELNSGDESDIARLEQLGIALPWQVDYLRGSGTRTGLRQLFASLDSRGQTGGRPTE